MLNSGLCLRFKMRNNEKDNHTNINGKPSSGLGICTRLRIIG